MVKRLFLPFLCLSLMVTGLSSLVSLLGAFLLPDELREFILPVALAVLAVFRFLRPTIKCLEWKNPERRKHFVYQMMAVALIALPAVISQCYLNRAAFSLISIEEISQAKERPLEKYFSVKHHGLKKQKASVHQTFEYSGRRGENLDMRIFVALPFENGSAWGCVKYSKTIKADALTEDEIQEAYIHFVEDSNQRFNDLDFYDLSYLERVRLHSDRKGFKKAADTDADLFYLREEPFEARLGSEFFWAITSFIIGCFIWAVMLSYAKIGPKMEESEFELLPFLKDHPVTSGILLVNILVFIATLISDQSLMEWGSNFGPLTRKGEYWRLLTSVFLHAGVQHLLFNAYGMVFAAIVLEPILGRGRYLLVYLLSGIGGSIASCFWYAEVNSVGASGAVFGLYGALVVVAKQYEDLQLVPAIWVHAGYFIAGNLIFGFLANGVDNAAHIGGLLTGLLWAFTSSWYQRPNIQYHSV